MQQAPTSPADIRLFDEDVLIRPYEAYQVLRDQAPVFPIPEMNMHYVTRYDLVRQVLKDTSTYSSKFDDFMMMARMAAFAGMPEDVMAELKAINAEMIETPPTMLTLDEPEHTKYRSLVSRLFTGSQVKLAEAQVQALLTPWMKHFLVYDPLPALRSLEIR